ncbi:MAG: murein DD-endopeptidase MepM/ murein hydrolase activator NlpD [Myxococcota bacterium]|jgi:murein DD-endopeptidase MepM/ murein hydrolase activator NlpD
MTSTHQFVLAVALCATLSACASTHEAADYDFAGSRVEYVMLDPADRVHAESGAFVDAVPHGGPADHGHHHAAADLETGIEHELEPLHAVAQRAEGRDIYTVPNIEKFAPMLAGAGSDIVVPYPTKRFFRGFGRCYGERYAHPAIDLGGVGPQWGIGTPIRAMSRSKITFIGRGEDDPGEFGTPDKRSGTVVRGRTKLPRSKVVDGYGRVYFFTKTKGRWRSGTVVVTKVVDGTLTDHRVRYMHLGAVHPNLKVGDTLDAGQELGVMGGTGVQESAPHVHIDIQDPAGRRVDVAPLIGLAPTAEPCGPNLAKTRSAARKDGVWSKRATIPTCGQWERQEDFASGKFHAHDVRVHLEKGRKLTVELVRERGKWKPRVDVFDTRDGRLIGVTSLKKRRHPVRAKVKRSGKRGKTAVVELSTNEPRDVVLRVTAWPSRGGGVTLPRDGSYRLKVRERCRR